MGFTIGKIVYVNKVPASGWLSVALKSSGVWVPLLEYTRLQITDISHNRVYFKILDGGQKNKIASLGENNAKEYLGSNAPKQAGAQVIVKYGAIDEVYSRARGEKYKQQTGTLIVDGISALDWLTPPIHEARADDRCRQFQQRFVDIQPSFKADSQLAKACKPAVRPLHHPPVFAQPLAALNASSGNSANDAPLPQVGSASLEVVAFVGVQLCRSSTGTSWQASNRRNRVHAPLEHLGVVPVRAADQDHQRDASGIYDDVPLGAELASVRGVWARFLAPRGLGTEEPSMLARLQSIWSCSRKRVSMAWCSCSQTPAAFQSRRRRQQVMPLP